MCRNILIFVWFSGSIVLAFSFLGWQTTPPLKVYDTWEKRTNTGDMMERACVRDVCLLFFCHWKLLKLLRLGWHILEYWKIRRAVLGAVRRRKREWSHPTVGVQQHFLSSSHEELNISPETWLRRNPFAQPDKHFHALVLKSLYEWNYHNNREFLTWGAQPHRNIWAKNVQPLRWDDSRFEPKSANPPVGWLGGSVGVRLGLFNQGFDGFFVVGYGGSEARVGELIS